MQLMYAAVLLIHSWLRWAVILIALFAILRAVTGASSRRPWSPADDRAGLLFTIVVDVQLLLGLLLYFALSPITQGALRDFGGAMGVSATRYWAIEHVFGMVVGVLLAHRGRARAKSIADHARRHKVTAIFFVLALVAILASIPWPGTPNARPLFRY
jgi:hypothetical protein